MKRILLIAAVLSLLVNAGEMKIAVAAGYKKPLSEVLRAFEEEKGIKVDALYGNMKQSVEHARNTDVALIIGDKGFLEKKSKLDIKEYTSLGDGKVVVAFARKITRNDGLDTLKSADISRIAMPQPSKAIYGVTGEEFLKNAKLYEEVKPKLYIVATIPQVVAYLTTGEVDAGIINLTAYLANRDQLGSSIAVDPKLYTPIEIVAGKLSTCDGKECSELIAYMGSPKAREIFKRYGL